MKILAIETSCDETAISLIEFKKDTAGVTKMNVLENKIHSQIEDHIPYGGVYPTIAKREHTKILPILLQQILKNYTDYKNELVDIGKHEKLLTTLTKKNSDLFDGIKDKCLTKCVPNIDYIAVTVGPGLEPALYVGVVFAQIFSILWNIKIIPVNHMEAHIHSACLKNNTLISIETPSIALLVSGGHTELILIQEPMKYIKLGQTLDDAVGEAFDKVARLLGLPYPGGPEISRLAKTAREKNIQQVENFTIPLQYKNTLNFSYSGLKTAVRNNIEKKPKPLNEDQKLSIALGFETTAIKHLLNKLEKAIELYKPKTIILGGGVSANETLQKNIRQLNNKYNFLNNVYIPKHNMTTDNALMIAITGYLNKDKTEKYTNIFVDANLSI